VAYSQRPARSRASYNWERIKVGVWQEWQNLPAATPEEASAERARLRAAARQYAGRHGMDVELRSQSYGRVVDLLFTVKTEAGGKS